MNPATSVLLTLQKLDLLPADSVLVVGVSGGTDSLALLHILWTLNLRLHVATLDHGLRGSAGAEDARFVVQTAQTWRLPVTEGYADVSALAQEQRLSIEAAARAARYDFLASVAHEIGAQRIAVAHHADDQVETILLHLLRGSGLSGLAGMPYASSVPGHPDVTLIRPLLDVSRHELDAYCREHGLQARHDASNADARYIRNRLRLDLLPRLREVSPQVERRLLQLAGIAEIEDEFVSQAFHTAIGEHVERSDERIRMSRVIFQRLHPALQRRFVIWAAGCLGVMADVSYTLIVAAVRLGAQGAVGARAQLKSGVQLRVDYDAVIVERENALIEDDLPLLPEGAEIPIDVPGETRINPNWALVASLHPINSSDLRLAIPDGSTMVLRGRQAGDRITPLGLGGHSQKVSKRMIDLAVPRHVRDWLPLLLVDGKIAAMWWKVWTVSAAFAVTEGTGRVVYFELKHDSNDKRQKS